MQERDQAHVGVDLLRLADRDWLPDRLQLPAPPSLDVIPRGRCARRPPFQRSGRQTTGSGTYGPTPRSTSWSSGCRSSVGSSRRSYLPTFLPRPLGRSRRDRRSPAPRTWPSGGGMKNRSVRLGSDLGGRARVGSRPLLMCSIVTSTSFFSPHALAQGSSSHWSYEGTKCPHQGRSVLGQPPALLLGSGPLTEYDAGPAAPATDRGPRLPSSGTSRRVSSESRDQGASSRHSLPISCFAPFASNGLSECPAGEPRDEAAEERVVDQGQGNGRNQDRGHDPGPVVGSPRTRSVGTPNRQRAGCRSS